MHSSQDAPEMSSKRRLLRISLRTLFVFVTCIAVSLALFAHYARTRRAAIAAIQKAGGNIEMNTRDPSLLEGWFGSEVFGTVNKIDLREGEVDNALLAHLAALKELQGLDLSNADIDDEGLGHIEHLPLRELWLQGTDITDASAARLSKMTSLTFLQLNTTQLSDAFLEHLAPLPELENLGLRGTNVTSNGMKYLSRHPQLKRLDVYYTKVDDSGVAHLVDCPLLTYLGLSMTLITDAVFEHLDKLANLTDADLSGNQEVTTDAVLEFEKSHSTCDVEWYQ
jgi:Leucine-rich repeat (LRR) protein